MMPSTYLIYGMDDIHKCFIYTHDKKWRQMDVFHLPPHIQGSTSTIDHG
jgi:hypothetical protein